MVFGLKAKIQGIKESTARQILVNTIVTMKLMYISIYGIELYSSLIFIFFSLNKQIFSYKLALGVQPHIRTNLNINFTC